MKTISITVILLFLLGCNNKSEVKKPTPIIEKKEAIPEKKKQVKKITPPNKNETYTFHGKLGSYMPQVIMNLIFEGEAVSGSYYYSKHQKELELKGTINPLNNEIEMTESYRGETTGYFNCTFSDSKIMGVWSAKKNSPKKHEFKLSPLNINSEKLIKNKKEKFKKYIFEHESAFYNPESKEWETYDTSDDININSIDQSTFDFYYAVNGMNGHSGSLSGVGKMRNDSVGYFSDKEGCELKFKFHQDTVHIEAAGCENYAGARAHFGGSLVRDN